MFLFGAFSALSVLAQNTVVPNEKYTLPMRFDVVGDGVDQLPLELDYDLESAGGAELKMGSITLSRNTTGLKVLTFSDKSFLGFFYPAQLFHQPTIEAISRTGKVLWSLVLVKRLQDAWAGQLGKWNETNKEKNEIFDSVIAFSTSDRNFGLLNLREPFKICFSEQAGSWNGLTGQTRVCTPLYELKRTKPLSLQVYPISPAPPRVIAFNEAGALKDRRKLEYGLPVQFYAELSNGMVVDFLAIPKKLRLVEMLQLSSGAVSMMGEGVRPLQSHRKFEREKASRWMEYLGWVDTIGDLREFWEVSIDKENPQVMISGTGGGIFLQRFVITKLPTEDMRPYLAADTPTGTYINGTVFYGMTPPEARVSTSENELSISSREPQKFSWEFAAKRRGFMNRSAVTVEKDGRTARAFYEAYKGHPREFSVRGSILMDDSKKVVPVGEVAFNYWFENIAGWNNELLSRQRWGISLKGWRSLGNFSITGIVGEMQSANVDLKYRLTQGLWARDESWGLTAGVHDFRYGGYNYRAAGGGLFWARSMPKVFDDALNSLPFLRYPKWIDMDFTWYPTGLSENVKMLGFNNWAVNFHGKVMWTKTFFGEAGFGIKTYYYEVTYPNFKPGTSGSTAVRREQPLFSIPYVTIGLGVNF